jgi:methylenetetrahydrofolate dehydrogenase (NADP+) / methenyltetrahydrofolate cyclohydrolase
VSGAATAEVMDGKDLARRLLVGVVERAQRFRARTGRQACLATVLVGRDPGSVAYVTMKRSRAQLAGIESRLLELPEEATTSQVVSEVRDLSADDTVDGILLQHPVPPQVDERASFEAIAPDKDVDGVTMHSFASTAFGLPGFAACTPAGILRLLDEYDVDPAGQHAVVIGRSPILGKPVGMLLLARNATVTYCHSRTRHLEELTATADILVAAVGKPRFVRGDWIKPGAVVVDAGYNPGNVGDVEFDEVRTVARLITPVPGGVGPMTVAVLLEQTVRAAEQRAR